MGPEEKLRKRRHHNVEFGWDCKLPQAMDGSDDCNKDGELFHYQPDPANPRSGEKKFINGIERFLYLIEDMDMQKDCQHVWGLGTSVVANGDDKWKRISVLGIQLFGTP